MRTMAEYLDLARMRGGFASDRKLSIALNVSQMPVSRWRRGVDYPREETMMKIAELAQLDPGAAVIELDVMKATTPEIKALYEDILKRMVNGAIAGLIAVGVFTLPGEAQAAGFAPGTLEVQFNPIALLIINYATIRVWDTGNPPSDLRPIFLIFVWGKTMGRLEQFFRDIFFDFTFLKEPYV